MPKFTGKSGDFTYEVEWHLVDGHLRWHATVRSANGDIRVWPNGDVPEMLGNEQDLEDRIRAAVNQSIATIELT